MKFRYVPILQKNQELFLFAIADRIICNLIVNRDTEFLFGEKMKEFVIEEAEDLEVDIEDIAFVIESEYWACDILWKVFTPNLLYHIEAVLDYVNTGNKKRID